jgi:hypothetical protein
VALDVLGDDGSALIRVALHVTPDRLAYSLGYVNGAVVRRDGLLDLVRRVVPAWAGTALSTSAPPDAAEVLIDPAGTTVLAVEQPSAADRAVERAAQVVLVLVRSVTGHRPGCQQRLYVIEGVRVDQALVASVGHPSATVDHHPDVVGVFQ